MPGKTVEPRELSPISGTSILITSAPRSAISMYGTVPACAVEHATILTPCSGPHAPFGGSLMMFPHKTIFRPDFPDIRERSITEPGSSGVRRASPSTSQKELPYSHPRRSDHILG